MKTKEKWTHRTRGDEFLAPFVNHASQSLSLRNHAASLTAVLLVCLRDFYVVSTISVTLERRRRVVFAVPVEWRGAIIW